MGLLRKLFGKPLTKEQKREKLRQRMVRGKGMKLKALKAKPLIKKNGCRFDIPIDRSEMRMRFRGTPRWYAKNRAMYVSGKKMRLSKLAKKPIEHKSGVRFDIPANRDLTEDEIRRINELRGTFAPSKAMLQREKLRSKMVKGKGMKLKSLKSKPIVKKNGIRFDIPIDRSDMRMRFRGSSRWYAKKRAMYVSGKKMRLSKLAKKPIEHKSGVRFDIPANRDLTEDEIRRINELRGTFAPTKIMVQRQQLRERMVRGKDVNLKSLRTQPIEKKNGIRFDIPLERQPRVGRTRQREAIRSEMMRGVGNQLGAVPRQAFDTNNTAGWREDVIVMRQQPVQPLRVAKNKHVDPVPRRGDEAASRPIMG